jgi:curved DNA-binding protein CbpA
MKTSTEQITDYYQLLGVDPQADPEQIKQAYLDKIKQWHPDKNPDGTARAEEKTKALNQAYFVLKDAQRRKNYDRMLRFTRGKNFTDVINDEAIREKINRAYPALKQILELVRALYSLFRDAVRGNYRLPPTSVALIGGGLLYFLMPMDLVPDFIPVAGYLDDLAVLATVAGSLKVELDRHRAWKKSHPPGD